MELKLVRDVLTENSTSGKLYLEGKLFWCYTLEDKTRDRKVYGKTCIPCGRYPVDLYFWEKHNNWYPHLRGVPNFDGILIHKGNTPEDTLGCILVGMERGTDKINNCAQAYDPLKGMIAEALKTGTVFIEIVEADDAIDKRTSTL